MKYSFGILFLFAAFLSSCNLESGDDPIAKNELDIQNFIKQRNLTMQKSAEGLYYQLNTSGSTGKLKNLGDLVTFHYKLTLLDGTLVDSTSRSRNINRSTVWGLSETVFTLPLSLLKEGESGLFLLPSALAFGGSSINNIPPYSVIIMELALDAVRNESEQIDLIQKTYGIVNPEKTSTGLLFKKIVDNPSGALVSADTPVLVNYTGRLAFSYLKKDATGAFVYNPIFDSGTLGTPTIPFILSQRSLIPGFTEALKKMRVGEKAAVIIPYSLGYGTAGLNAIPGYSPLYFEITVIAP
ncbi:FKBP-type peptidyl-prolyl cis-trans isomerase [Aquirufa sp.]|uniref:FKBP-type peptidyl-prolyl cis-trans isomerase n=1 Tax=Aquirufa sp. TaxID=2676249 RepID=UPI0037BF9D9D